IQLSFDGATFTTTRSTLTMDKDSMLSVMFQKNSPFKKMTRDFNHPMKPYFVMMDRNPQYFEPILNYLRSGELVINNGVNIRGVHLESKFWGLAALTEEIEKLLELERLSEIRKNLHDNLECELTRQDIIKALMNWWIDKLQGLNLPGIDLSGLDLSSVNFSKTNLKNANLSRCTLDFSEMRETIIEGCNFSNAHMFKIIIKNANCKNVNFSGASLRGASITHCDMNGANFNSSDLELADLSNSNLRNADLSGASMKGVQLKNCVTTN
ncbi:predicted protein, partial [Naegleria gruberi]